MFLCRNSEYSLPHRQRTQRDRGGLLRKKKYQLFPHEQRIDLDERQSLPFQTDTQKGPRLGIRD